MNKKAMILVFLVMASMVFVSGCTSQTQLGDVKSQEDVQKTVTDVSTSIDNVESTLKDIDSKLG
ncbi:MAG: hypothetical protein HYT73_00315 [Candidatus Aenigmarchaeota archaeon]|nr:hypothetical protein [Candidatus Aenigmarchaeota archaeon]